MTPSQQHRRWDRDVQRVVNRLEHRFPDLECITYVDHPWPGWDGRSFDVWDRASTWNPARLSQLRRVRHWCMQLDGLPNIRHTILAHALWTSWAGYSVWQSNDHSGRWQHLHVTYW
jgi:hypothetical protein